MGQSREPLPLAKTAADAQALAGGRSGEPPDPRGQAANGNGSDAPDFDGLLSAAWQRAPVKTVVADSGYDSEANHWIARAQMGVRAILPAKIGRPSPNGPLGYFRRLMSQRFARRADAKVYGQRSQSETVNSMMKRNLGDYLRSLLPKRRKQEMLLRSLTHNLMLEEGRD